MSSFFLGLEPNPVEHGAHSPVSVVPDYAGGNGCRNSSSTQGSY